MVFLIAVGLMILREAEARDLEIWEAYSCSLVRQKIIMCAELFSRLVMCGVELDTPRWYISGKI